jgi:hypothetical protein
MNNQLRELADDVCVSGWGRLLLDGYDPVAAELNESRRRAGMLFRNLVESGSLSDQQVISTGQYGFTEEADEGELGFVEHRSHYVFNQGVPEDHPLQRYSPEFYGGPVEHEPAMLPLAQLSVRLHALLDFVTMAFLESLEVRLGLPFGRLAAAIAMGERLMRLQWYPPLVEGDLTRFVATTETGSVPIWGHALHGRRVVRASPHSDTGCWTWQVFATDAQLRFWDPARNRAVAVEAGDGMYGNACDFLHLERPELPAPVHWVDADGAATGRVSVSYFVHHRPAALVRNRPAGVRLYERLEELGYVGAEEVEAVESLLASATYADAAVVRETLAWEAAQDLCKGFSVPLTRYYVAEGGLARRDPPGPLSLGDG